MKQEVIDLIPPYSWNDEYGIKLTDIYYDCFSGLHTLFTRGVTGLCCDSSEPLSMKTLADVSSSIVALPEHQREGEIPTISDGSFLRCKIEDRKAYGKMLLLRGTLSSVMEENDAEGTGELAVSVCNTLAMNDFIPYPSKTACFSLKDVSLKHIGSDFLVEIAVLARKRSKLLLPMPKPKDGSLDLDSIKELSAERR